MKISALCIVILFTSCSPREASDPLIFSHEIQTKAKPWTDKPFDINDSTFAFAITSDLNGGEREGVFSHAIKKINVLRPEFILSVGDLIDGGTEDTTQLQKEFSYFDSRAEDAIAPFFYVGGNHDLTNRVMTTYWNDRYGRTYYHFIYKNVLFLILNSEDYSVQRMKEIYEARDVVIQLMKEGKEYDTDTLEYYQMPERSTGFISKEQNEYFAKVIQDNPNVRWTFLFMHKPVWMKEGEGSLTVIEDALKEKPYTLFNGHFHSFSHTKRNGRDYTILATTGGSQNPNDPNAFDHFTWVTMTPQGPSIAHIKLDGILDSTGQ